MGCFGGLLQFICGNKTKAKDDRKLIKKTRKLWESMNPEKAAELEDFQRAPSGVGFTIPLSNTAVERPISRTTILKVRATLRNTQEQVGINRDAFLEERKSRLGQYDLRREAVLNRKKELEEVFINQTRIKLMEKTAIQADATRQLIEMNEARCQSSLSFRRPTPCPVGANNTMNGRGSSSPVYLSGPSTPAGSPTGDGNASEPPVTVVM